VGRRSETDADPPGAGAGATVAATVPAGSAMDRPDRGGILPRMTGTDTTAPIVGPTEPAPISGRRRAVVWALVVVASVVGLVAIHAMWINEQLLSNSTSSQTSAALIRDAAVRRALSGYIVDQIYSNVDVANEIKQQLPSQLKPLSAPAAAALRDPAVQGVNFLLERPSIQALFVSSASDAHRQLVNVLEDKTGLGVTTGNGTVQINLSQLIRQVGTDLGLPSAAVNKLPPTAGVITVMHSSQLGLAQTGVRAVRIASVWLVVLVLAILALALYLAEGIRRATLRNIGWAFVIVGLVVFVARRIIGDYVVGGLTTSTYEVPAQHAWVIGTSTLGDLGWATVFYGVLIVLGAVLAGPTRAATAVRRWIAPIVNDRPGVAWTGLAVLYILVVLWGGTNALQTLSGILVLGALLAAGAYVLRRQTLSEFPDATVATELRPLLAGAAGRVRAWGSSQKLPSGWGAGHSRSTSEELAHLADLHERGVLTDEEFARAKAAVLER